MTSCKRYCSNSDRVLNPARVVFLQNFMKKLSITFTFFILSMVLTIIFITGCKTSTTPQSPSCDNGFHLCPDNPDNCCENTSSEIDWEIFEFGNPEGTWGDNNFVGGAIVNENDIWVIGLFYDRSPSGQSDTTYNAVNWNGTGWEKYSLPIGIANSLGEIYGIAGFPVWNIFPFSEDNIWFQGMPHVLNHWDGEIMQYIITPGDWWDVHLWAPGGWALSTENIYLGTTDGEIIRYDGNELRHIATLSLPLVIWKIHGANNRTYALGNGDGEEYNPKSILAEIVEDNVTEIILSDYLLPESESNFGRIYSFWCYGDEVFFLTRDGLFVYNSISQNILKLFTREQIGCVEYEPVNIIGKAPNNIFIIDAIGQIFHYDGSNWTIDSSISEISNLRLSRWTDIDLKDDMLVLPGAIRDGYDHPAVAIGRIRN